jgi:short-subunit dehydrogenase
MLDTVKKLAVVTGASTGIGFELAKECSQNGFDLIIAADEREIEDAKTKLGTTSNVDAVQANLATVEGVDALYRKINGRPIDALLANAGRGLGRAFLDQDFEDIRYVIDTNVTGTV